MYCGTAFCFIILVVIESHVAFQSSFAERFPCVTMSVCVCVCVCVLGSAGGESSLPGVGEHHEVQSCSNFCQDNCQWNLLPTQTTGCTGPAIW